MKLSLDLKDLNTIPSRKFINLLLIYLHIIIQIPQQVNRTINNIIKVNIKDIIEEKF